MAVLSLVQLARNACVKQAKSIHGLGDAPFELVRPILAKVENPKQLHNIETSSPQLKQQMSEFWVEIIKRDIPFWREVDLQVPQESWYDFYLSLRKQAAEELEQQAEQVRQVMNGLNSKKVKQSPKVVNARKLGLPKEKPTSLQRYANFDRKMGGIEPVFVLAPPAKDDGKGLTPFSQQSRWLLEKPRLPSQTKSKKSALPVVKRNGHLCIPTHQLNKRASTVTKAPRSFLDDYKYEQRRADIKNGVPNAIPGGITGGSPQRPAISKLLPMASAAIRSRPTLNPVSPSTIVKARTGSSQTEHAGPTTQKPVIDSPAESVVSKQLQLSPKSHPALPRKRRLPPANPLLIPKKRVASSTPKRLA
ncbi:hypothetical protein LOZ51_002571 [Ophidiomyces ophidiicola]|nr:hypothetical protein LOZ55_005271 [Ophidiomyces ophidiicola]KAI1995413.1 hypothetical protein LOZ54_000573 [Ophidiomyces ophidiicola]KAI1997899.1 hypothetical protein LOZ51_002571 [Ophidiomyces ophidiicola]